MTENKVFKLMDLVEDIEKVNKMILIHKKNSSSDIMLTQYQAKKTKLISYFIGELNSPALKSAHSFVMIKRLLDKFYTDDSLLPSMKENDTKLNILESVL